MTTATGVVPPGAGRRLPGRGRRHLPALAAMTRLDVRSLPLRSVRLQLAAAVALVVVTLRVLDSAGAATQVLQGVALLLAATLALAVDEPGAEVLDATPTSFARRVGRRLVTPAVLAVVLWLLALAVVWLRGADVPALLLTLQASALLALGLAVPAGLRRWRRMEEPGLVAGPVLLGFLLAVDQLLPSLVPVALQSWWQTVGAEHLRWAGVLVAASAVLLVGLSDPATAVRHRRSA